MYEGIRVIASFIFYDVPSYMQESKKNPSIFSNVISDIAKYRRRILKIN
jgi:hypothetical protein